MLSVDTSYRKCCYLNSELESKFVLKANGSRDVLVCMGYKGECFTVACKTRSKQVRERKKSIGKF